ncbi:MAG: TIGR00730 family Rossman fold protein [Elusimicrobia bacterium]|nr:TIGR00730 family Rossman fold protein [Elusimicrobiota bacterium]
MRRALCIVVTAAATASAQRVVTAPVAPVSVLPLPGLAMPVAPTLTSPVAPAGVLPALPTLAPALALPAALSLAQPAARALALPTPAVPMAGPAGVPNAVAEPLSPESRHAPTAKAVAAAAAQAAPALDLSGGAAELTARTASFFDGSQVFPSLVEADGVAGFVRELQEPSRQLQAMGVKGTVTIYGSARIPSRETAQAQLSAAVALHGRRPKDTVGREAVAAGHAALRASHWYEEARRFGRLVAKNSGGELAVVTGGGPGIMEGANRGAFEAGGKSVGYNITLPFEQSANPWITPGLGFEFESFATRKMNLRHGAVGLAYFPGGYGTFDELFEVLTLMQTGKMPRVPIVLVGQKSYWKKIIQFREFAHQGLISKADLDLFVFAENAEQAWAAIEAGAKR